jgi:hypothetical protein
MSKPCLRLVHFFKRRPTGNSTSAARPQLPISGHSSGGASEIRAKRGLLGSCAYPNQSWLSDFLSQLRGPFETGSLWERPPTPYGA